MQKLTDGVMTAVAAGILVVSQNTLRAWAQNGRIPTHRSPAYGYRLFRRSDLQAFLKKIERPVEPP